MAQSAYMMTIEQDCNTVAKTYVGVSDAALEKVREGAALLDISRLQNHQTRNSDDILTCRKKMVDAMSGAAVCGDDLGLCLDWTGRYIDPSSGGAILSADLGKLADLITRPTDDHTWAGTGDNKRFVEFLNTKRKYIESVMQNCEGTTTELWDMFLEDALPRLHLAARDKLQEMRQSCTEITAQCASGAMTSLEDFDVRALSVFAVNADKTANEICADTRNACTALMNLGGAEWAAGVQAITDQKTLDTVLYACRIIGQNCIIETCSNNASKFGACRANSNNYARAEILTTKRCWDEVAECIRDVDPVSMKRIADTFGTETDIGWPTENERPDNGVTGDLFRLTKHIWGSCTENANNESTSKIKPGDTLMSWLATNTDYDSCNGTMCRAGQIQYGAGDCKPSYEFINIDGTDYWCGNTKTHMCEINGEPNGVCAELQDFTLRVDPFTNYLPRIIPGMQFATECKHEEQFITINGTNYWCGDENHLCDDGQTCARKVSGETMKYVKEDVFSEAQTWFRPAHGTEPGQCLPVGQFSEFSDGIFWCDPNSHMCDNNQCHPDFPQNNAGDCKPIDQFIDTDGDEVKDTWCNPDENVLECDGGYCKTGYTKNTNDEIKCRLDSEFQDCNNEDHEGCNNGKTWCNPMPYDNGTSRPCENNMCPINYVLDPSLEGCVPDE
jgi:hypothetical protein